MLLTTSGTTGQPKFVTHTLATLLRTAESSAHWGLDGDQIAALFCPMVHASGLFTLLACLRFGVPFVLLERFEPEAVLDSIERHRCTWLLGLPFMFVALRSTSAHARARSSPYGLAWQPEMSARRNCKSSLPIVLAFPSAPSGPRPRQLDCSRTVYNPVRSAGWYAPG